MAGLLIRSFTPDDVAGLNTWVTDDEILLRFAGPGLRLPLTFDQLVAPADGTCLAFAVAERETGRTIGHAQLRGIDRNARACRIARVIIGDPALRGQGLGGELLEVLVEYARNSLGVAEVTLNVYSDNTPAIRCYRRFGFEFTGRAASVSNAGKEMRYVVQPRTEGRRLRRGSP